MDEMINEALKQGLITFEKEPASEWYKSIIRSTKNFILYKINAIEYARINNN